MLFLLAWIGSIGCVDRPDGQPQRLNLESPAAPPAQAPAAGKSPPRRWHRLPKTPSRRQFFPSCDISSGRWERTAGAKPAVPRFRRTLSGCGFNPERVRQGFHHSTPASGPQSCLAGTAAAGRCLAWKDCRTPKTHAAQMGRIPAAHRQDRRSPAASPLIGRPGMERQSGPRKTRAGRAPGLRLRRHSWKPIRRSSN